MALKISRTVPLGPGSTGFRFENSTDTVDDQRCYEEGRQLERARFRRGSLAQQIYERMTSDNTSTKTSAIKSHKK